MRCAVEGVRVLGHLQDSNQTNPRFKKPPVGAPHAEGTPYLDTSRVQGGMGIVMTNPDWRALGCFVHTCALFISLTITFEAFHGISASRPASTLACWRPVDVKTRSSSVFLSSR